MKHLIVPLLLAGSLIALSSMEASAVVCVRGAVRAGCVAAGGATTVGAAVVRPVARPVARPVVAPVRRRVY